MDAEYLIGRLIRAWIPIERHVFSFAHKGVPPLEGENEYVDPDNRFKRRLKQWLDRHRTYFADATFLKEIDRLNQRIGALSRIRHDIVHNLENVEGAGGDLQFVIRKERTIREQVEEREKYTEEMLKIRTSRRPEKAKAAAIQSLKEQRLAIDFGRKLSGAELAKAIDEMETLRWTLHELYWRAVDAAGASADDLRRLHNEEKAAHQ